MGKALEWMGVSGCMAAAAQIIPSVDTAKSTDTTLWAICSLHGDKNPSFKYDADKDLFFCFGCRATGDLVGLWNLLRGRDADSKDGFKEFKEKFAPGARDSDWERGKSRREKPRVPEAQGGPRWTPRAVEMPAELWMIKAEEFVRKSEARLLENPEVLRELESWGISPETARACRFGWNDRDRFPRAVDWGFASERNDKGRERKLGLPEGLVIPYVRAGRVVKLKIRRPHPDQGHESMRGKRYHEVRGGSRCTSVYGRRDARIAVVVETERDGCLLWQEGRELGIVAVAMGSASNRPDADAHAMLSRVELILNSLDSDVSGIENALGWWSQFFANQVRHPVPPRYGKDIGDAVRAGLDAKAWLLAGIPNHVRMGVLVRRGAALAMPETREVGAEKVAQDPDVESAYLELKKALRGTPVRVVLREDVYQLRLRAPEKWQGEHVDLWLRIQDLFDEAMPVILDKIDWDKVQVERGSND